LTIRATEDENGVAADVDPPQDEQHVIAGRRDEAVADLIGEVVESAPDPLFLGLGALGAVVYAPQGARRIPEPPSRRARGLLDLGDPLDRLAVAHAIAIALRRLMRSRGVSPAKVP
jgi:hypothetical protein